MNLPVTEQSRGMSGPQQQRWHYDLEESRSRRGLEQGWGDLEGLLDRGMQLLRHGRAGAKNGADLGAVDACLQDALACFKAAADIDGSDTRVLVCRTGLALQMQHKRHGCQDSHTVFSRLHCSLYLSACLHLSLASKVHQVCSFTRRDPLEKFCSS